jgi:hypothetical protein
MSSARYLVNILKRNVFPFSLNSIASIIGPVYLSGSVESILIAFALGAINYLSGHLVKSK